MHDAAPAPAIDPAGHDVQLEACVPAYVPAAHVEHGVVPPALALPGLHAAHDVEYACAL